MKLGDVVRYRGRDYRVGPCRTDTSIELVEMERESVGLWVSRAEVLEIPPVSGHSPDRAERTEDAVGV
jgi:hypothetical protein